MTGEEFKKIRQKLKLSAAALGHALGYKGRDKNIAVTIYRLESGRPIPVTVGRLLEMFDAYGVPRAWTGETAQRKYAAQPKCSGPSGFWQKIGEQLEQLSKPQLMRDTSATPASKDSQQAMEDIAKRLSELIGERVSQP